MTFEESIGLLTDSRSAQRRKGARRLRKLGEPQAGPALLEALQKELEDPRTWETQYQMIMALGECDCRDALPFLESLVARDFEATMVLVGLGDALVRLQSTAANDAAPVLALMESGNDDLTQGAFRAMAMLRMVPQDAQIGAILAHLGGLAPDHPQRFWPAAAAAGWSGPQVERFLEDCEQSSRDDIREAAARSAQGKYKKWQPL